MSRATAPVIVSEAVKEVIDEGGSVIIECLESVSKKGTATVGKWVIHIASPDKKTRRMLVLKLSIEPEVIKTAVGVMSKLIGWGLPTVCIPSKEGQIIEVFKDGSCLPVGGHIT